MSCIGAEFDSNYDVFTHWVAGLLQRCPNLSKVVIHLVILECQRFSSFPTHSVQLMMRYMHVDLQFVYK